MKTKIWLVLILIMNVVVLAQKDIPEQDESFDPMKLNEPPMLMTDKTLIHEIITDIDVNKSTEDAITDSFRVVEKMGWKVQIFSTSDFYLADTLFKQARRMFSDYEVEKIFNSPYYKIRVGNCKTREESENLLSKAIDLDFKDSWIIRTKVKVEEKVLKY